MLLGGPGAPAPLLRPATQRQLWTPQTILRVNPAPTPYNTHFSAYGLGWFLRDVRGYLEVAHTGGNVGMVSKVTLLPELHLGIIVLTNQERAEAFEAVSTYLQDQYLGLGGLDRVQEQLAHAGPAAGGDDQQTAAIWQQVAAAQKAAPRKPNYTPYVGRYHDAWFGDVTVSAQGNHLWVAGATLPAPGRRTAPLPGQYLRGALADA